MTTERVTLDIDQPSELFVADVPTRRVTGLAIPSNGTATKGGRTWRFKKGSVKFGSRTPLLAYHDVTRPVGLLTSSHWSERGLVVEFQISKTPSGDEFLQLANDGVVGLSVGIDVPVGGAKQVGDEFHVNLSHAAEVSFTPVPAFSGTKIDSVAMAADTITTEGPVMPENVTTPTVNVTLDATALGAAIAAGMTPAPAPAGPTPQPVPVAVTQVAEPALYRFDGGQAAHSFVRDAMDGYHRGNSDARNRIDSFLAETFVATTDVTSLTPTGFRPDLYVDSRPAPRVLGGLVSGGVLTDINPFVVPRFATATNLVNPHVEGVEPTLATFTATSQTVNPSALSGKAEINRELVDKAGPQVDAMIWAKMVNASVVAAEARIAALLTAFVDASPLALSGVDAVLADDLDTTLLGVTELERYSVIAANPALFGALATARDGDGRKLFPAVNPVNADGTTTGRRTLDLNGLTAAQVNGMADSYLIEKAAIWQWISAPRKLNFDIQVKSVYIGFWQYAGEAIIDDAGIQRITYAA